MIIYDEM